VQYEPSNDVQGYLESATNNVARRYVLLRCSQFDGFEQLRVEPHGDHVRRF
jgi:hypothetical protein